MASVYPSGLDSLDTTHSDLTHEVVHAATDNDQSDAINKIEAELGTNPKGTHPDVKSRLDAVDVAIPAAIATAEAASIPLADLDTNGTLAANSDSRVATQKATKTYVDAAKAAAEAASIPIADLDTDGTLAANSDARVATQKATKTYVDTAAAAAIATAEAASIPLADLDTDGTLTANSDARVPSQKAVKTYVDARGALTKAIAQVAHGFSATPPQAIRYDGTQYVLSKADTATHAEVIGLVAAVVDVDHFIVQMGGYISGFTGLIPGDPYFLDTATGGGLTVTRTTTPGQVDKPLLVAVSTTSGVIINMRGEVIPAAPAAPTVTYRAKVLSDTTPLFVQEGLLGHVIQADKAGKSLISAFVTVTDAPQTTIPQIAIRKNTAATNVEMLSTSLTIDLGELSSETAATPAVINGANAAVALGDIVWVDCDAAGGTHAKGLEVRWVFQ